MQLVLWNFEPDCSEVLGLVFSEASDKFYFEI